MIDFSLAFTNQRVNARKDEELLCAYLVSHSACHPVEEENIPNSELYHAFYCLLKQVQQVQKVILSGKNLDEVDKILRKGLRHVSVFTQEGDPRNYYYDFIAFAYRNLPMVIEQGPPFHSFVQEKVVKECQGIMEKMTTKFFLLLDGDVGGIDHELERFIVNTAAIVTREGELISYFDLMVLWGRGSQENQEVVDRITENFLGKWPRSTEDYGAKNINKQSFRKFLSHFTVFHIKEWFEVQENNTGDVVREILEFLKAAFLSDEKGRRALNFYISCGCYSSSHTWVNACESYLRIREEDPHFSVVFLKHFLVVEPLKLEGYLENRRRFTEEQVMDGEAAALQLGETVAFPDSITFFSLLENLIRLEFPLGFAAVVSGLAVGAEEGKPILKVDDKYVLRLSACATASPIADFNLYTSAIWQLKKTLEDKKIPLELPTYIDPPVIHFLASINSDKRLQFYQEFTSVMPTGVYRTDEFWTMMQGMYQKGVTQDHVSAMEFFQEKSRAQSDLISRTLCQPIPKKVYLESRDAAYQVSLEIVPQDVSMRGRVYLFLLGISEKGWKHVLEVKQAVEDYLDSSLDERVLWAFFSYCPSVIETRDLLKFLKEKRAEWAHPSEDSVFLPQGFISSIQNRVESTFSVPIEVHFESGEVITQIKNELYFATVPSYHGLFCKCFPIRKRAQEVLLSFSTKVLFSWEENCLSLEFYKGGEKKGAIQWVIPEDMPVELIHVMGQHLIGERDWKGDGGKTWEEYVKDVPELQELYEGGENIWDDLLWARGFQKVWALKQDLRRVSLSLMPSDR